MIFKLYNLICSKRKLSLFAFTIFQINVYSQVTIDGPTCVLSGRSYHYAINAAWDASSNMQVCLDGGSLTDFADTCKQGTLSFLNVTWNSNITNGIIKLRSSNGNVTLNVFTTQELYPGQIDSSLAIQWIKADSIPTPITCSASTGGGCSPTYLYQWEKSLDRLTWEDIQGANDQDLNFSERMTEATFFRRKTTEISSNETGYSTQAGIFLTTQPGS